MKRKKKKSFNKVSLIVEDRLQAYKKLKKS